MEFEPTQELLNTIAGWEKFEPDQIEALSADQVRAIFHQGRLMEDELDPDTWDLIFQQPLIVQNNYSGIPPLSNLKIDKAKELLVLCLTEEPIARSEYCIARKVWWSVYQFKENVRKLLQRELADLCDQDFPQYCAIMGDRLKTHCQIVKEASPARDRASIRWSNIIDDIFRTARELWLPPKKVKPRSSPKSLEWKITYWQDRLSKNRKKLERYQDYLESAKRRYQANAGTHPVGQYFHLGLVGGSGNRKNIDRLNREKDILNDQSMKLFKKVQYWEAKVVNGNRLLIHCERMLDKAKELLAS